MSNWTINYTGFGWFNYLNLLRRGSQWTSVNQIVRLKTYSFCISISTNVPKISFDFLCCEAVMNFRQILCLKIKLIIGNKYISIVLSSDRIIDMKCKWKNNIGLSAKSITFLCWLKYFLIFLRLHLTNVVLKQTAIHIYMVQMLLFYSVSCNSEFNKPCFWECI